MSTEIIGLWATILLLHEWYNRTELLKSNYNVINTVADYDLIVAYREAFNWPWDRSQDGTVDSKCIEEDEGYVINSSVFNDDGSDRLFR